MTTTETLNLLTSQLLPYEGWRVEVVTAWGETQRFIVGRSSGRAPCHIALKRRDSSTGEACWAAYRSVRGLYRVRGK